MTPKIAKSFALAALALVQRLPKLQHLPLLSQNTPCLTTSAW